MTEKETKKKMTKFMFHHWHVTSQKFDRYNKGIKFYKVYSAIKLILNKSNMMDLTYLFKF